LYNRSALLANESSGCRPGYPDIIEDVDGAIFITETDKTAATVHRVDAKMLELLFGQLSETPKKKKPAAEGLAHTPVKENVSQAGAVRPKAAICTYLIFGSKIVSTFTVTGAGAVCWGWRCGWWW
jgi:hypothetical protein